MPAVAGVTAVVALRAGSALELLEHGRPGRSARRLSRYFGSLSALGSTWTLSARSTVYLPTTVRLSSW